MSRRRLDCLECVTRLIVDIQRVLDTPELFFKSFWVGIFAFGLHTTGLNGHTSLVQVVDHLFDLDSAFAKG